MDMMTKNVSVPSVYEGGCLALSDKTKVSEWEKERDFSKDKQMDESETETAWNSKFEPIRDETKSESSNITYII